MEPAPASPDPVRWERRRLGLGTASALVIGNMIGAGVFTTSGFALADLGSPGRVLTAWAVGGAIALCGALSYAGLARRIPESGGEYTFLARTVHPAAGFVAGWVSLLAGFTGPIAAAALAFEAYLGASFAGAVPERVTGTAVIALAAALHGWRVAPGARAMNAAVLLKLLGLGVFVGLAAARLDVPVSTAAPGPVDLGAFAVTLVWISFSYSGWNGAVYLASEIRDPDRNLPRALWIPTLGVAVLYLALNAVFVLSAPVGLLAGRPDVGTVAAEQLGGPAAGRALAALVGLALFTSISAMVAAGPRVYARMARDGVFPAVFARGDDAPAAAIALQAALAILVVWATDLGTLLGTLGFTLSVSAALTVAAAVHLRVREGAAAVPIPGFPVVPAVFMLATLGVAGFLVWREPAQAATGLAIAGAGLPAYWWARRKRSA